MHIGSYTTVRTVNPVFKHQTIKIPTTIAPPPSAHVVPVLEVGQEDDALLVDVL